MLSASWPGHGDVSSRGIAAVLVDTERLTDAVFVRPMDPGSMGHGHFNVLGVEQHRGVGEGGDNAADAWGLRRVSEVGRYEATQRARFVRDLVDFVNDCVETADIDIGIVVLGRQNLDEVEWFEVDTRGQPEAKRARRRRVAFCRNDTAPLWGSRYSWRTSNVDARPQSQRHARMVRSLRNCVLM